MSRPLPRLLGYTAIGAGLAAAGYVGLVTGACPLDLGIGRRVRPLGPQLVDMAAPREVVFEVIAEPYLGRTPRALADKLRVLERGSDMVLAAHFTRWVGGWAWSPRRWRRCGSPGPSGSTSGWSAGRSRTSRRRSSSPSRLMVPARGWPTPGRSQPTCGGRASDGVTLSLASGSTRSRPPWPPSRPKPNDAQPPQPGSVSASTSHPLRAGSCHWPPTRSPTTLPWSRHAAGSVVDVNETRDRGEPTLPACPARAGAAPLRNALQAGDLPDSAAPLLGPPKSMVLEHRQHRPRGVSEPPKAAPCQPHHQVEHP
jgi:hypothetical protein